MLASISAKRNATVITLIHRQETISLLGFPIRGTPPGRGIEIILHTPGGLVLAASQIAKALSDHEGRVTAVVPHYAMSGGTVGGVLSTP
jgi:ClpP class serine protease